ncbi:MAG: hypothetical protein PUD92_05540 [Clostridiales bacterium]|nr:hypothetical protein [Clostridiales bacterium]
MENKEDVKYVGLKVTGLVIGIIAAIALISVIFSLTVLPVIKYNNAQKNAEAGNYDVAARILYNMDYKDSKQRFGEYSLAAGEKYLSEGDIENASIYLTYALNSENDEASAKAQEYFNEGSEK